MKSVLLTLITIALAVCLWNVRAFSPTSPDYLTRLHLLQGWSSVGYYAFNCSGLISSAHGSKFYSEKEMFAGTDELKVFATVSAYTVIDESKLSPGDVAAFAGPHGNGQHVAAYLGAGVWEDGDNRRGYVSTYRLLDVRSYDPWFQGRVHLLRWITVPTRTSLSDRLNFFREEQEAIAR